jgi:hypothetical protein
MTSVDHIRRCDAMMLGEREWYTKELYWCRGECAEASCLYRRGNELESRKTLQTRSNESATRDVSERLARWSLDDLQVAGRFA